MGKARPGENERGGDERGRWWRGGGERVRG